MALGFALMFNVMRVVNLAHPEVFMVAMFASLTMSNHTENVFLIVAAGLVGAVLLGLLVDWTVLRSLRRRQADVLMTAIATSGVAILLEHVMAAFFGVFPRSFPSLFATRTYAWAGVTLAMPQLINIALGGVLMMGAAYYVYGTSWGRATRAIAERPDVAEAFGINTNRVAQVTVVVASLMAALGGISIASMYNSAWVFVAPFYTLKSFIAMLVAGNRRIEGVMAVGLTLGVMEALTVGYISSSLRDVVAFLFLLVVLFFRPNGVFGSYEVRT